MAKDKSCQQTGFSSTANSPDTLQPPGDQKAVTDLATTDSWPCAKINLQELWELVQGEEVGLGRGKTLPVC
jgi:hypothetical protein